MNSIGANLLSGICFVVTGPPPLGVRRGAD